MGGEKVLKQQLGVSHRAGEIEVAGRGEVRDAIQAIDATTRKQVGRPREDSCACGPLDPGSLKPDHLKVKLFKFAGGRSPRLSPIESFICTTNRLAAQIVSDSLIIS